MPYGSKKISDLISQHENRRLESINLVASENLMSPEACSAMQSDLTNRYCIPPEGERPAEIWDYPNQNFLREISKKVELDACTLFGGQYTDLRPLSGNNVAYIVLKALVRPGGNVFSVPQSCGGHFATREICEREGHNLYDLPYDYSQGRIDLVALADLQRQVKPDLVFLDASMQLFPHPVSEMREILGPDVIISYDASHTMGLIAGGEFQNPLAEGANLLHGSTHKSLFGPQKGIIVCKGGREAADNVARRVHEIITPLFVSNMHIHHVAALGVAFEEMLAFGSDYAYQVVCNAKAFGAALASGGLNVLFPELGFTQSHQILCAIGAKDAMLRALGDMEKAGIHANGINAPFGAGHGFRFGLAEVTRRGMKETQVTQIAHLICELLSKKTVIDNIARSVSALASEYNELRYCFANAEQSGFSVGNSIKAVGA